MANPLKHFGINSEFIRGDTSSYNCKRDKLFDVFGISADKSSRNAAQPSSSISAPSTPITIIPNAQGERIIPVARVSGGPSNIPRAPDIVGGKPINKITEFKSFMDAKYGADYLRNKALETRPPKTPPGPYDRFIKQTIGLPPSTNPYNKPIPPKVSPPFVPRAPPINPPSYKKFDTRPRVITPRGWTPDGFKPGTNPDLLPPGVNF